MSGASGVSRTSIPPYAATTSAAPHRPRTPLRIAAEVLLLAGIILLFHAKSLSFGLFMDDHPHFRQLREVDWSLTGLTAACRLELFGNYCNAWWMPDVTLRFFRPVSFGIMKLEYTLGGWNPLVLHAASLGWHLAACLLLAALLRRLGVHHVVALAVAALFAMHPAHVATVQWIAAQTELMVTVFLLGATLLWAKLRAWPDQRASTGNDSDIGAAAALVIPPSQARRAALLFCCLALFAAALGCRENAIMFPFVMLAAEPLLRARRERDVSGGTSILRRPLYPAIPLYLGLAGVVLCYLTVRSRALGGVALPPKPYVFPPSDPGFLQFLFDKAGYYLLGEFLLAPCVPFGGVLYLREHLLTFYLLVALVLVGVGWMIWHSRGQLLGWLAPVWLLAFMLPVLPSFESPHHLYLPGVGWALVVAGAAQALLYWRGMLPTIVRWRIFAGAIGGIAVTFAAVTYYYALTMDVAQQVEDNIVAELVSADPPLRDGETVFIANLPLIAHYVRLPVEERLGLTNLTVVALSWSPRLLGVATPAELTWIDDKTIELRIADDRWFAGPLGYLARAASGEESIGGPGAKQFVSEVRGEALAIDAPGPGGTSTGSSAGGISGLRMRFAHPIGTFGYRLFWGSRLRWAYEVRPPASAPVDR